MRIVISNLSILYVLLFSACNSTEDGIKAYNSLPKINIQSHSNGAILLEGRTENFYAIASDANNGPDELQVAWFQGSELVCDWAIPDAGGTSNCDITPEIQFSTIRAEVRDIDNGGGMAEINVVIDASFAPEVELISPVSERTYHEGELIPFTAIISDAEDRVEDLTVRWQSSIDGDVSIDTTPDSNGRISDFHTLSPGQHIIALSVSDTMNKSTQIEILVNVSDENALPSCAILQPNNNDISPVGQEIVFVGQVSDDDNLIESLQVTWTSDKDGELFSASPSATGETTFATSTLSANVHTITMEAEDPLGATCQSTIVYRVGSPPVIDSIDLSGLSVYTNDTIQATAIASDVDGDSLSYTWNWWVDDGTGAQIRQTSTTPINTDSLDGTLFFDKGDIIYVEVSVSDGSASASLQSSNIIVLNSAPFVYNVLISPIMPIAGVDDLECMYQATDADGDSITPVFLWLEDGVTTPYQTSTISSTLLHNGVTWECQVSATDGIDTSNVDVASVTIGANVPDAVGGSFCAAAGVNSNSSYTLSACVSDQSIVSGDSVNASYTMQFGSHIMFMLE